MFRFKKEEKTREYFGNTIYLNRPTEDIEKYLDTIVRHIERYVKQKGEMPKKLHLGYENYNKILEHNKSLIYEEEGKQYTFGVEIVG